MKIAIIVDHNPELMNGASYQSRQFVDWLVRHGHEIHLIFPFKGRREFKSRPGVRYHPIPSLSISRYKEYCAPLPLLKISLWLKSLDVDLIHAETINPTMLLLGYWIKRRRNIPMFNVLTAHVPFYYPILFPKEKIITKYLLRIGKFMANRLSGRIEGTFVLSEGMKETLTRKFYSLDPKKVFVLTRPLDPARFARKAVLPGLNGLFSVPRGKRLLTLSRLCTTKNVEFLIRAFARRIYPRNKSLHFFVAGDGPLADELKEKARGLSCPNIHFLGLIPFEAVPALLYASDFFLYSSMSETFCNVVCEAKYSGLPVVALDDRGGVRAQIQDRRTGILVRDPAEGEFARRFFELYADSGLQDDIRRDAHRDVLVNNDPDKIYSSLMDLYFQACRREPLEGDEIRKLFSYDRSFIRVRESEPSEFRKAPREIPNRPRPLLEDLPV